MTPLVRRTCGGFAENQGLAPSPPGVDGGRVRGAGEAGRADGEAAEYAGRDAGDFHREPAAVSGRVLHEDRDDHGGDFAKTGSRDRVAAIGYARRHNIG